MEKAEQFADVVREWVDWDYVNKLGVDQMRQELAQAWSEANALNMALRELPEVPSHMALQALCNAGMGLHDPDVLPIGKELQRRHGLDAIPPKTEYEAAAGLWSLMRAGILAARSASEAPISAEAVKS